MSCHATGCTNSAPKNRFMCAGCWFSLQGEDGRRLRHRFTAACRRVNGGADGGDFFGSEEFLEAAADLVDAVAALAGEQPGSFFRERLGELRERKVA